MHADGLSLAELLNQKEWSCDAPLTEIDEPTGIVILDPGKTAGSF